MLLKITKKNNDYCKINYYNLLALENFSSYERNGEKYVYINDNNYDVKTHTFEITRQGSVLQALIDETKAVVKWKLVLQWLF